MKTKEMYLWRTLASFLVVLFSMPLGHALMIIMEHTMEPSAMHVAGFLLGLVGLIMVIVGVFVKGDTRQTIWGLLGGLLFWTGWVEFLFLYYARRYGVQPEIENGEVVTKPEYLIMPASFGLWMMVMVMYIFSTLNGYLDTKGLFPRPAQSNRCTTHDTPYQHRYLYGSEHDALGLLSAFDVLLRQEFPWRPPSCYLPRWARLLCWFAFHVETAVVFSLMGSQYPHGHRHSYCLLDAC